MENYATILLNKEQKPIGYLYTDIDDMEEDGLLIKTKTFMKEYNSFVSYKNNKKPDKTMEEYWEYLGMDGSWESYEKNNKQLAMCSEGLIRFICRDQVGWYVLTDDVEKIRNYKL
jgi:hypothetical protein